ncbi:bifunctional metallophosphatase/5'-nucleotidase [uncultured Bacteroides sp.]|uniref:bifunctional metallophosphatase/5'-nucleotidase n=1 Tax=uncultured Bacteroides sp. TaxID=162156 RepID=UPI002AAB0E83|nr:bifunctional metallophosphatase/5'-nucleotidase [uncultured Bacteroides sp.]
MKLKISFFFSFLFFFLSFVSSQEKIVKLKLLETTDIHGNYFPYSFIRKKESTGSLARVYAMVQKERKIYGDNLILVDNGDILQGNPSSYYYNYIDTISPHVCAEMMNFMGYNVGNMGNHDVETGHKVFDRWIASCHFSVLGANIIRTSDNTTYCPPYAVFEREGVKVVVLGMITSAIPVWLAENLWSGMRFDDMKETARKWMKKIRDEEHPDLVVGLFHSGQDAMILGEKYIENASLDVAREIPGFDIVMIGHDHIPDCKKVMNVAGDSVLIINPANNGVMVADVDVTLKVKNGKVSSKEIKGTLKEVQEYGVNKNFMTKFAAQYRAINKFVSKRLGYLTKTVSSWPAYLGPAPFVDLVHEFQLNISGADVSFTAPLSFDAEIKKGDISVSDMFNLYKYENMLYTMKLSGKEIKNYLEESYYLWTNRMKSPEDHLIWLNEDFNKDEERTTFKNFSFNFDSAAGIIYTVDVTKPKGHKINIISMANGKPFRMDHFYKVALNSYRGNGGGELLTKGAGIPQNELRKRIIKSTDKDLRFYIMKYIEMYDTIHPKSLNCWKFIPEKWVKQAKERDARILIKH